MKDINTKISTINGTNRIVSSTNANWSNLRPGSNIIIDGGKTIYTITSSKSFFYIKSFTRKDRQEIEIDPFDSGVLMVGDKLSLSYKEYSIVEAKLNKPPEKDETITISAKNGATENAILNIKKGKLELEIVSPGKFAAPIRNFQGIDISYAELPDRKIIDYTIEFIHPKTNAIMLNKVLPDGVDGGKISCNKWEAFLSTNYMEGNKSGVECDITRDFTPNFGLSYMQALSPVNSTIYNDNLRKIDSLLAAINKKLNL